MRSYTLIGMISFIWIGMIFAIGLENIVIIEGVHILKPVSFQITRAVFGNFNKVQLVLFLALLVPLFVSELSVWELGLISGIGFILVLQIFYIFPTLSHQVDLYVAGVHSVSSVAKIEHRIYGVLEIIKLCLLTVLGFRYILSLRN